MSRLFYEHDVRPSVLSVCLSASLADCEIVGSLACGSFIRRMNEVTLRWAQLVLGLPTTLVCNQVN